MTAKDLINYMIPPLRPQDKMKKARQWMEELRLTELPVIEEGQYLGLIDEEMLLNEDLRYPTVGEYPLLGSNCVAYAGNHYYDVLKTAGTEGFRIVAVLDEYQQYMGVISIEDVVEAFAKNSSVSTPGAIIVLRLRMQDYSLSDICRLIEANDLKVLSSYLGPHAEEPGEMLLTLKLNSENVTHTISTMEQHGYIVESAYNNVDSSFDEQERIDILIKYLKI